MIGRIAAVDPGKYEAGWAVFEGGRLVDCGASYHEPRLNQRVFVSLSDTVSEAIGDVDVVHVESMKMRRNTLAAVPRLMELMMFVGALAVRVETKVELVEPQVWTSGRPKAANHRIIRSRLDAKEAQHLDVVLGRTLRRNHKEVLDAVGIGLYALQRL